MGLLIETNPRTLIPLTKDLAGVWTVKISIPAGYFAYKFRVDDSRWEFDPLNEHRKVVRGVEYSGLSVGGVRPHIPSPAPARTRTSTPTPGASLMTLETVPWDTPAMAATSLIVRFFPAIHRLPGTG